MGKAKEERMRKRGRRGRRRREKIEEGDRKGEERREMVNSKGKGESFDGKEQGDR